MLPARIVGRSYRAIFPARCLFLPGFSQLCRVLREVGRGCAVLPVFRRTAGRGPVKITLHPPVSCAVCADRAAGGILCSRSGDRPADRAGGSRSVYPRAVVLRAPAGIPSRARAVPLLSAPLPVAGLPLCFRALRVPGVCMVLHPLTIARSVIPMTARRSSVAGKKKGTPGACCSVAPLSQKSNRVGNACAPTPLAIADGLPVCWGRSPGSVRNVLRSRSPAPLPPDRLRVSAGFGRLPVKDSPLCFGGMITRFGPFVRSVPPPLG